MAFRPDELRGYRGRWSKGRDRTEDQHSGSTAFHPRTSAAERRATKEILTSKVRQKRSLYDKHARGEPLTGKERASLEWASPRKMDEQRAKTGDAIVPRREFVRRERSLHRSYHGISGRDRTTIKKTFTGKPVVVRGEYRQLQGPGEHGLESRVRRNFDVTSKGGARRRTARQMMSNPKQEYAGRRRAEP